MNTLKKLILWKAAVGSPLYEHTINNNPAVFTTEVAKPLKGLSIPFTSETGITGLTIYRTGKNLFDQQKYADAAEYKNRYNYYFYTNPIILKPNTKYTITPDEIKNVGSGLYLVLYIVSGSDPTAFSGSSIYPVYNGATSYNRNFTTGETGVIRLGVSDTQPQEKLDAIMSVNWQIEFGETGSAIEPYTGTTIPVSWQTEAGTVYGGTLDALTGVLTVTSPESKTVQLDPVTLSTLIGDNVIWTDTNGDNTIIYLSKKE